MLIKNLNIKNYGAIKQADLEFKKGFNLISGENGQGKSHIIRALAYLLLNHTEAKIEDDCNWDAESFAISTLVEHGNKSFDITNIYRQKGGASKKLTITDDSNQTQLDSNTDVTDALAEHFDPAYCKPAIVSFQGEMDIVSAKPAQRRDFLKKIYDLEFHKEIEYLQNELDAIKTEEAELQKELFALQNKDYDIKELKELPITEDEYNLCKKDYDELRQKKENIESQIKLYDQMEKEINSNKMILGEYETDVQGIKGDILSAEQELKDIKADIDSITDKDTSDLENELSELRLQRVSSFDENKLKEIQDKYYEELGSLNNVYVVKYELVKQGKCPTCERDFESTDLVAHQIELDNQKILVQELKEKLDSLKEQKNKYDKIIKENTEIKNKKDILQLKINSIKKSNEEKRLRLESQLAGITRALMELENSVKYKEQKVVEMSDKITELEQSLPQMKPELPANIDHNLDILLDKVTQYERIQEENKFILEHNIKIEQQQKEDLKKVVNLQKKSEAKISEINNHDTAIKILRKDFPNYVINTMKSDLEKGMNELLDDAYNGRYHVKMVENRSGLSIVYGQKDKDVGLASGAEKNMFNIGFKNSFNALAGLGVLILDEALNFADDNIAVSVFNVIQSKIDEGKLNQVFVITHKESVKKLLLSEYSATGYRVESGKISPLEN